MSRNTKGFSAAAVNRRVADLVARSHDGNVHAAAKAIGVPYMRLYDVVNNRAARGPSLQVSQAIAAYYGLTLDDLAKVTR